MKILKFSSPALLVLLFTIAAKIDIADVQAVVRRRGPLANVPEVVEASGQAAVVVFGILLNPFVYLLLCRLPAPRDVRLRPSVLMETFTDRPTIEADPELCMRLFHASLAGVGPGDALLCDAPDELYRLEARRVRWRPYDLPSPLAKLALYLRVQRVGAVRFEPVRRCGVQFLRRRPVIALGLVHGPRLAGGRGTATIFTVLPVRLGLGWRNRERQIAVGPLHRDGHAARFAQDVCVPGLRAVRWVDALGVVVVVQLVVVAGVVHNEDHLRAVAVFCFEGRDQPVLQPPLEHVSVHLVVVVALRSLGLPHPLGRVLGLHGAGKAALFNAQAASVVHVLAHEVVRTDRVQDDEALPFPAWRLGFLPLLLPRCQRRVVLVDVALVSEDNPPAAACLHPQSTRHLDGKFSYPRVPRLRLHVGRGLPLLVAEVVAEVLLQQIPQRRAWDGDALAALGELRVVGLGSRAVHHVVLDLIGGTSGG